MAVKKSVTLDLEPQIINYPKMERKMESGYNRQEHLVENPPSMGIIDTLLRILATFLCIITCPVSTCYEYERAIIFSLGRLAKKEAQGPDATGSTKLLAQTTLRNMLGIRSLAEMLQCREQIALDMQTSSRWGVKVERVELKDIRLPLNMQRAMAAEAEATRESNAKIIAAKGELDASHALHQAAVQISKSPMALQLRFLQTLNTISAEKNSTIVFPFPIDLLSAFVPRNANMQNINSREVFNEGISALGAEGKEEFRKPIASIEKHSGKSEH